MLMVFMAILMTRIAITNSGVAAPLFGPAAYLS
jgi:hypothetical protein